MGIGINSPLPVKLENETKKAAKIMRSFVDKKQNGLDHVVPRSVLQKAKGFAIFTVVKAGFMFSARAGSGIVIARLEDGTWSPPSAIGIGGFGFGGQGGAEVTDFMVVLNSRSAVSSFISAGSLQLGGNLSVAVGPLGRNAEVSGSVNTSGRLAAMYSYSKTRDLFGGVSVEGTIIVARQDANRLAYGGKPTIKQVLGGAFDWPPWASVLIREIEKCTGTGARPGEWGIQDEDGEGGGMGWDSPMDRDRKGSGSGGYVFGEGMGSDGSAPPNGRKRSGSLFGAGEKGDKEKEKGSPRPNGARRTSSLNPLSSGTASPRKAGLPSSSSESYNAGLTWDSDGPMNGYGNRSRSGSNPNRLTNGDASRKFAVPFDSDYEELSYRAAGDDEDDLLGRKSNGNGRANGHGDIDGNDDLLRTWDADSKGLSKSFSSMSTGAKMNGGRIRSNSRPQPFQDIDENEGSPFEVRSSFSNGDPASHSKLAKGRVNVDKKGFTNGAPTSPFGDDDDNSHRQYDDFGSPQSRQNRRETTSPKPNIPLKAGLGSADDGYARAVAQYEFKATASGDLGMKSGQVVVILDTVGNGEWWRGRSGDGKEGIFPSNYVEVLEIPKTVKGGVGRGELKGRMARLPFD